MFELVKEDDPELMREEGQKEQEGREDKFFCPLCAKYHNVKEYKLVQMGPVQLAVCRKCDVVLHNLNLIIDRAKKKIAEKKEEADKLIKLAKPVLGGLNVKQ